MNSKMFYRSSRGRDLGTDEILDSKARRHGRLMARDPLRQIEEPVGTCHAIEAVAR